MRNDYRELYLADYAAQVEDIPATALECEKADLPTQLHYVEMFHIALGRRQMLTEMARQGKLTAEQEEHLREADGLLVKYAALALYAFRVDVRDLELAVDNTPREWFALREARTLLASAVAR